jgi:hypothetical protein
LKVELSSESRGLTETCCWTSVDVDPTTRAEHDRHNLRYPSDLTDAEWAIPGFQAQTRGIFASSLFGVGSGVVSLGGAVSTSHFAAVSWFG